MTFYERLAVNEECSELIERTNDTGPSGRKVQK